jgi:hypothetical protein
MATGGGGMAQTGKPVSAERKRVYRTPTLKMYGAIRELTTGGTGNAQEGEQKGNKMKRP